METLQPESSPVVSESPSLILRATHIVLLAVDAAEVGPWGQNADGLRERTATLSLRLEQTLKGDIEDRVGERFRLAVHQTGLPSTRVFALPGAWTNKPLDVGQRLVVFSVSSHRHVRQVLEEPEVVAVATAEEALLDATLAMRAERQHQPVSALLQSIPSADRSRLERFFGEYVAARMADVLAAPPEELEAVLRFVEDPRLSPVTRTMIFEEVEAQYGSAGLSERARARIALSAFRLLAMPEASAMHDAIASETLPKLLGLGRPKLVLTATTVFAGAADDRRRAEAAVAGLADPAQSRRLLEWLRAS
jgi:hypothetical protein